MQHPAATTLRQTFSRKRSVVVVGGGIAGLATAIALARTGWEVTVLEQSPVFWEVGAGLTVTANGLRALNAIGVADRVRDSGYSVSLKGLRSVTGRELVRLADDEATRAVGIYRRSLHSALLDGANAVGDLRAGARVLRCDVGQPGARPASLQVLEAGAESTFEADLVVAADGANSVLRPAVAPDSVLDHSGFSAWRAIVPDDGVSAGVTTWWGDAVEFGVQRISESHVSFHCLFPHNTQDSLPNGDEAVRELLRDGPPEMQRLVDQAAPGSIFRHDIRVAGPLATSWSGRTVLGGDAAHAMLPTLHQGANQGLEDAVVLASSLARTADLREAAGSYDQLRLSRTQWIARKSRQLARWGAGCPAGPKQSLQHALLARLPEPWARRFVSDVTNWHP